jgi:hypothetical protein
MVEIFLVRCLCVNVGEAMPRSVDTSPENLKSAFSAWKKLKNLSMISTVELPSNDKLTTRCPIMLQMRNAEERSASVKVVWKDKLDAAVSSRSLDFNPKRVNDANWDKLTDIIAEAQDHIIKRQQTEVARDIVSVEMKGPHCEDLTLIDLPGIVPSQGKGESATLSDDIQGLSTET